MTLSWPKPSRPYRQTRASARRSSIVLRVRRFLRSHACSVHETTRILYAGCGSITAVDRSARMGRPSALVGDRCSGSPSMSAARSRTAWSWTATAGCRQFKAPTTPADPSNGFLEALTKAAAGYDRTLGGLPRRGRADHPRHDPGHEHADQPQRRPDRDDHDPRLPRHRRDPARLQERPDVDVQRLRPALQAARPALPAHGGGRAGHLRRGDHHPARRGRGPRRRRAAQGRGRRGRRRRLPACLRQPRQRAARRGDRPRGPRPGRVRHDVQRHPARVARVRALQHDRSCRPTSARSSSATCARWPAASRRRASPATC